MKLYRKNVDIKKVIINLFVKSLYLILKHQLLDKINVHIILYQSVYNRLYNFCTTLSQRVKVKYQNCSASEATNKNR